MKFNFKNILRILLVLNCTQAWSMNGSPGGIPRGPQNTPLHVGAPHIHGQVQLPPFGVGQRKINIRRLSFAAIGIPLSFGLLYKNIHSFDNALRLAELFTLQSLGLYCWTMRWGGPGHNPILADLTATSCSFSIGAILTMLKLSLK